MAFVAKRGFDVGRNKKSHSKKTKKRLAAKRAMLEARAAKKKKI